MSVRSGVFTKYVVEFPSLKLSNDLWAGDMCIDADVTVTMSRGVTGSTFSITLYDLPEGKVNDLASAVQKTGVAGIALPVPVPGAASIGAAPTVKISLGYFDTSVGLVLEGIYESVESTVTGDKLVTTIKGREKAVYACKKAALSECMSEGPLSFADAAGELLSNPKLTPNAVDKTANVDLPGAAKLRNLKFNGKTVLAALDELARRGDAELLIADGTVFLGAPVKYDKTKPSPFTYASNLAKFDRLTKLGIKGKEKSDDNAEAAPEKTFKGFQFTVVGDPTLRPAQVVSISGIKDYASPEFRIRDVKHVFSAAGGYSCVGNAAEVIADAAAAREIDATLGASADSATRDLTDKIRAQASENPVVEIAAVKATADPYRADLYYGQTVDGNETQPSINVAVDQNDEHVYRGKPIASPFAWRKCGLVTPVYPGMKAVVAHSRGSATDGVVTGYIWSKAPDFGPPISQLGDWWLCLPTDFDASQPPDDFTKAANDLTGQTGKRVIEVKGLRITVGSSKLGTIGTRPTEGGDDEILIEHASGTSIKIDSRGAMTIDASSASLTIKGNVVIQGNLEIK
ncbi:MAG: hypothetical protein P4M09_03035 [Devosia sp.]|nr:hypothetical protein [Devosia sp.]